MRDIEIIIRRAGNLTKAAKALGIQPSYLCQVRKGKRPVGFDLALQIEAVYKINARDFLTRQLWEQLAIYRELKHKQEGK